MANGVIETTMSGLVPTVTSAEDTSARPDFDVNVESNERARLWEESSKALKRLRQGYEANIASYHGAYDQLKKQLVAADNLLQQERDENIIMAERLKTFDVLLKSERTQKAGLVEGKIRCEAQLEKYKAEVASSRRICEQLKSQLATAQTLLGQECDEKKNLAENLQTFRDLMRPERIPRASLVRGKARNKALVKKHYAEFTSIRRVCEQLKSQVATAQTLLGQEHEKKNLAENLQTFKVLLKSERAQNEDLVDGKARCEAPLKECKAELASSRQVCEQLKSQLATAQTSLGQERDEKTSLAENLQTFKVLLKSERTLKEDLVKGKARCEAHLKECKAEVAWSHRVCEQLEGQLIDAKASLGQERGERNALAESLGKFKILLKSERAQRAEIEESKMRCEALLEEQTSRRLLGTGINVQGAYQSLPEIEASIRQTLTITVSEWVEQGSHGLLDLSNSSKWFIPEILAHLFTLCKHLIDGLRQQYVNMFLGKGEGALEDDMDTETAHFMHKHLRRHHLTLFPAMSMGNNRDKTCRLITTRLGAIIADFVDGGACHDTVSHALAVSGIEEITGQYLRILASCAVQHPAVSFSCDCYRVQSFDKRLHFEPIDGDGDVARGGQCMVIFPALITNQGESLANKRFVLGPQERG